MASADQLRAAIEAHIAAVGAAEAARWRLSNRRRRDVRRHLRRARSGTSTCRPIRPTVSQT